MYNCVGISSLSNAYICKKLLCGCLIYRLSGLVIYWNIYFYYPLFLVKNNHILGFFCFFFPYKNYIVLPELTRFIFVHWNNCSCIAVVFG